MEQMPAAMDRHLDVASINKGQLMFEMQMCFGKAVDTMTHQKPEKGLVLLLAKQIVKSRFI